LGKSISKRECPRRKGLSKTKETTREKQKKDYKKCGKWGLK